MEAEYTVASVMVRELLGIRELLKELKVPFVEPLRVDNQAALKQLDREGASSKAKHVDVSIKFVGDYTQKGILRPEYRETKYMPADGLTKALPAARLDGLSAGPCHCILGCAKENGTRVVLPKVVRLSRTHVASTKVTESLRKLKHKNVGTAPTIPVKVLDADGQEINAKTATVGDARLRTKYLQVGAETFMVLLKNAYSDGAEGAGARDGWCYSELATRDSMLHCRRVLVALVSP
ncbi:hypothetical protein PC117_g3126 [Phytophthora cactorum]|uniref:Reverse transcriptase Ty1/copia-type domain-containing protein n=1 Tax=Phytophthora cactorum TaxID=29920 RepID=A0A8T1EHG9_9STRA|nr:hypothetical protein PC117_g3126 [Phytophthora cactorum]KAG3033366.1 hypothetical protein PC120_g1944 [Phytophthora cactorum]